MLKQCDLPYYKSKNRNLKKIKLFFQHGRNVAVTVPYPTVSLDTVSNDTVRLRLRYGAATLDCKNRKNNCTFHPKSILTLLLKLILGIYRCPSKKVLQFIFLNSAK